MPNPFVILTDDFCDLPSDYIAKHPLTVMPTEYTVDGTTYSNDTASSQYLALPEFYAKLRAGSIAKTSALSMEAIKNAMEVPLKNGYDVLYIAFSSALSGTYNNGRLAKEELRTAYPNRKIFVVDSLSASLGQGLLVHYALTLQAQGRSIESVTEELECDKQKFCHYFTVDDLHFLHRGGRVSKATAVVGSMLGIKPVLHVNSEGKLIPIGKVRGRKQSLQALVDKMAQKIENNKNDVVYISHGDCEEDAVYVAGLVKKKFGIKSFLINYVGATIGAHSGPGTVALFFIGNNRTES